MKTNQNIHHELDVFSKAQIRFLQLLGNSKDFETVPGAASGTVVVRLQVNKDRRAYNELAKAVKGLQAALQPFDAHSQGNLNHAHLLANLQGLKAPKPQHTYASALNEFSAFLGLLGMAAQAGSGRGAVHDQNVHAWISIVLDEWKKAEFDSAPSASPTSSVSGFQEARKSGGKG